MASFLGGGAARLPGSSPARTGTVHWEALETTSLELGSGREPALPSRYAVGESVYCKTGPEGWGSATHSSA